MTTGNRQALQEIPMMGQVSAGFMPVLDAIIPKMVIDSARDSSKK
jgi:hypothetical protein